jgi:hypothetical protein
MIIYLGHRKNEPQSIVKGFIHKAFAGRRRRVRGLKSTAGFLLACVPVFAVWQHFSVAW